MHVFILTDKGGNVLVVANNLKFCISFVDHTSNYTQLPEHLIFKHFEDQNPGPYEIDEDLGDDMIMYIERHEIMTVNYFFTTENGKVFNLPDIPNMPIEDLDLSVRAFNVLKALQSLKGMREVTTRDLAAVTLEELRNTRGSDQRVVEEVTQVLEERGIYLQ